MQVFSARVKAGAIVLDEDVALTEGTQVTVIADFPESRFDVTPEKEAALLEALSDAEQDDVIRAADLLDRLQR